MRNIHRNGRILGNLVSIQINAVVIRVERLREVCARFLQARLARMSGRYKWQPCMSRQWPTDTREITTRTTSDCCFKPTKQHRRLSGAVARRDVVVG